MATNTGDCLELAWLWQRLSLAVIRGNATLVMTTTTGKNHRLVEAHGFNVKNFSKQQRKDKKPSEVNGLAPPAPESEPLLNLLDLI